MIHFLEHLPNLEIVKKILKETIRITTEKIYIIGPMFYLDYLKRFKLQFFWSHWTGHTCLIEPYDIINIMKQYGINNYELNFKDKHIIKDSSNINLQLINCDIDRFEYDANVDPPKNMNIIFDKKII